MADGTDTPSTGGRTEPARPEPAGPARAERAEPARAEPAGPAPAYAERLVAPWWMWLAGLGLAALFAAEVFLGAPGPKRWIPYAVLLPLTAAGLAYLGRLRVAVTDGELRVDDARLPVRYVAGVTVLEPEQKRLLLGPAARPDAFVVQRPWLAGAVQVHLNDPADPTPYWVVSSRRPAVLAAAVLAARRSTGGAGPACAAGAEDRG